MSLKNQNKPSDPRTSDQEETTDRHPSFVTAGFNRVSANPGASLFGSEIRHSRYVVFNVHRAARTRNLGHDWIHQEGLPLIEIAMSEAQFGALVSSFGDGGGVPVTLTNLDGERVENPPYAPRTEHSLKEVGQATDNLVKGFQQEVSDLRAAFTAGAGRKEMAARIHALEMSVDNAVPNAKYVAQRFTEHVENVVTKARSDIEGTARRAALGEGVGEDLKVLLPGTDAR